MSTAHDERTVMFARLYRDACVRVQQAWPKVLATPPDSDERREAASEYRAAREVAIERRRQLLEHASYGIGEVPL